MLPPISGGINGFKGYVGGLNSQINDLKVPTEFDDESNANNDYND